MLQKIRWFLLMFGILVILVVAFQNNRAVELDLLFFRGEYPLTVLLLATAASSFLCGALMTAWMLRSRSKSQLKKAITPLPPTTGAKP